MKKTIIFSNYDDLKNPYYAGGGAYAIHEVSKRLAKNYRVRVLTGKYPNSKNAVIDKVLYKRIGVAFGGPKVGQLIFQLSLPYYAITQKYDIWFESFTPPISTALLQFFTKKPVVGLVHMLSGKDMRRKYKLPFDMVEKAGIKKYKYLGVTNSLMKDEFQTFSSKIKFYDLPNGVESKTLRIKRKNNQILFMGRIEVNQKGLDLLIKAFLDLIKKNKKLNLVVAGAGEKKQIDILKKLIHKYNLSENVSLVGKVSGNKKHLLLNESSCIVVPSRFETFSLTCLEALAYGIPLVVFDIKGLSWIPKDLKQTAKPFSVTSLSQVIEKTLKSKSLQFKLSKAGKDYAKKFTWQKSALKYQKVIEELI